MQLEDEIGGGQSLSHLEGLLMSLDGGNGGFIGASVVPIIAVESTWGGRGGQTRESCRVVPVESREGWGGEDMSGGITL